MNQVDLLVVPVIILKEVRSMEVSFFYYLNLYFGLMCLYVVFNEVHSFRDVEEDFGVIRDNGPISRNSTSVEDMGVRG